MRQWICTIYEFKISIIIDDAIVDEDVLSRACKSYLISWLIRY